MAPVISLRNFIFRTICEAAKGGGKKTKGGTATLSAMYDSDLRLGLFNLKQRNIVRSNGKIRKVKNGYRVSIKYNGPRQLLKDAVINFYGSFIKVV